MEYLAPEHQDLAKKGLADLHGKLPSPQENVLDDVKLKSTAEFSFPCVFRIARDYTNRCLPTAAVIWEYLLGKAENEQQKFVIMDKLFHVQVSTGPWEVALETATNLFNEIMDCSLDSADQTEANTDSSLKVQLSFDACINLGSIHRLLKDLRIAEDLYKKAREIAVSMKDFDRETLAKIHLAICLLDRGELKEALETYFKPLVVFKCNMSSHTRTLFLQYYGNACRSAADWGRAKEYLREALDLSKEVKDAGLVSSCCGDLGNVYRSEGRYKDSERLHTTHYNFALSRGDIHGLAIACGNIGFLKFYNPEEFDDSVVYQFIEYSLAEQVGDFARMGIAFNKIGKLYTTLGYYEEAVEMFQIALDAARRAGNIAGEGMAWGNLGNVHRALEQFEDAIACHLKYRDNAERRLDIGGLAIMQHQLALDYFLSGNLPEAERSILSAFQTLEKIRAQIGEDDKSKLSNFEKNQAEVYNLLQVVLVAQRKYKEAFVLADASRGRALSEIVRKRLCGSIPTGTETNCLNDEFITESFDSLLEVSRKLSTTLVLYSVVEEFDKTGAVFTWVYAWVLHPTERLHFSKSRLQSGIETKVELNDEYVISLRRSMGLQSQSEELSKILRCEKHLSVPREGRVQLATLQSEDVLKSLKGLENMFAGRKCEDQENYQYTGAALCNADTTDEKLPEFPTAICFLEDHSGTKSEIESDEKLTTHENNVLVDPDHVAVNGTCTDCPSANKGTWKVIANNETLNSQDVSKKDDKMSETSFYDSSKQVTEQDHSLAIYITEFNSVAPMQPAITSVDSVIVKPNNDGSTMAVKDIAMESLHAEITEWKKTSQDSVDTGEEKDILDSMAPDLSGNHSKETSNSGPPVESANHTATKKDISDPMTPNDNVSDAMPEPIDTKTEETGSSEVSVTLMQSANHTEIENAIDDHLPPNNDVSTDTLPDIMNGVLPDHTDTHSKEIANDKAFTNQSANHVEVNEDKLDHSAPGNEVLENTPTDFKSATDMHLTEEQSVHLLDDPVLAPWRPMLSQLHKILIEPITDFLPCKDENPRITLILQDFLLKVPFAALQGDTNHRYLMEDYVISTSPSIHFLELGCGSGTSSERNTSLEVSLLAVGNPKMPFEELAQLPSAQREVRMISEIIDSEFSEVLIGAQAKKKDVVAAMPKHKILHFATHAVIDDSDSHGDFSMKGLIVLAKSGNECNGLLTAEEVRSMELNAELVVLSCCDTGLGKVTGDGVLGLSRAFLVAGAACVIVTLWKIDDRSSSELMTSFYREYKTSRDAAVSLQKAMKNLQANEDTRSPQHWAAFSIVGTTCTGFEI